MATTACRTPPNKKGSFVILRVGVVGTTALRFNGRVGSDRLKTLATEMFFALSSTQGVEMHRGKRYSEVFVYANMDEHLAEAVRREWDYPIDDGDILKPVSNKRLASSRIWAQAKTAFVREDVKEVIIIAPYLQRTLLKLMAVIDGYRIFKS